MKARRGLMLLLGLLVFFMVIKMLPKKSEVPTRAGRSGDSEMFQEESGRRGGPSKANKALEPPVVAINALEGEQTGETFAIGRNLFRFAPPKPVPPPPAPPGGHSAVPGRGGVAPSAGVGPPSPSGLNAGESKAAPPKPQPPSIGFKYLGSFGLPGRMLAVFADGEEIYDVFEGETFSDQYILKRINPETETVEIAFVGFDDKSVQKLEVGP